MDIRTRSGQMALLACCLSGCGVSTDTDTDSDVFEVTSTDKTATLNMVIDASNTMFAGKQAMTFYLGGNQKDYCAVTVTAEYMTNSGGRMYNKMRNQPELDVDCTWQGKYYVLSSNHPCRVTTPAKLALLLSVVQLHQHCCN